MDEGHIGTEVTRLGALTAYTSLRVEILAYAALGLLLVLTTLLGLMSAAATLWDAVLRHGEPNAIVATVDRLLFVFMLVEIMHTVRVSFRSGTLVCEPFLIVGLIASIRRVLVITLKSSQGGETPAAMTATLLELVVLGGLILVMVGSIVLLRRRGGEPVDE